MKKANDKFKNEADNKRKRIGYRERMMGGAVGQRGLAKVKREE
jgi:hypothetical protein